jgi:cytochrome c
MIRTLTIAALALAAAPAFAQEAGFEAPTGDVAAGESAFRQCQSCHVVTTPDGETVAGRNARTGPNLYGMIGNTYAYQEDFRYSDIIQLAGEQGHLHDTEADFVAYLQDPTGHLQELTGDNGRGKMSYRVRQEEDALNLYAFLAQWPAEGTAPTN